jgi:hypothetical protein
LKLLASQAEPGWLRLFVAHRLPLPDQASRLALRQTVDELLRLRLLAGGTDGRGLPKSLREAIGTESAAALGQLWKGADALAGITSRKEALSAKTKGEILQEWGKLRDDADNARKKAQQLGLSAGSGGQDASDPMKRLLWQLKEMETVEDLLQGPADVPSPLARGAGNAAPPGPAAPAREEEHE